MKNVPYLFYVVLMYLALFLGLFSRDLCAGTEWRAHWGFQDELLRNEKTERKRTSSTGRRTRSLVRSTRESQQTAVGCRRRRRRIDVIDHGTQLAHLTQMCQSRCRSMLAVRSRDHGASRSDDECFTPSAILTTTARTIFTRPSLVVRHRQSCPCT